MVIKNEILNELIKVFKFDEYQEATTIQNNPDVAYEVDLKKDGDTVTLVIEKKELVNKEKQEFEKWLDTVDDEMFQEALTKVHEITGIDARQLDEDYNSPEFKGIIKLFKQIVPAIAQEKINNLSKYLK